MSYKMGIIRPHHPDANTGPYDKEEPLVITSFLGPDTPAGNRWMQLSLGDKSIRLSPGYIFALLVLCQQRFEGTDSEMINLSPKNPEP